MNWYNKTAKTEKIAQLPSYVKLIKVTLTSYADLKESVGNIIFTFQSDQPTSMQFVLEKQHLSEKAFKKIENVLLSKETEDKYYGNKGNQAIFWDKENGVAVSEDPDITTKQLEKTLKDPILCRLIYNEQGNVVEDIQIL